MEDSCSKRKELLHELKSICERVYETFSLGTFSDARRVAKLDLTKCRTRTEATSRAPGRV